MCFQVIQSVGSTALTLAYPYYHTSIYPLNSTEMDEIKHDTPEPVWIYLARIELNVTQI